MHTYLFFNIIAAGFVSAFVLGMGIMILYEHQMFWRLLSPFYELRDPHEKTSCFQDSMTLAQLSGEALAHHSSQLTPETLKYLQEFKANHEEYVNDKRKQHDELESFYEDTEVLRNTYSAEFPYAITTIVCSVVEIFAIGGMLYGSQKADNMNGSHASQKPDWLIYLGPWFVLNGLFLVLLVALMCVSILYHYFVVVCVICFVLIPARIMGGLSLYLMYREIMAERN